LHFPREQARRPLLTGARPPSAPDVGCGLRLCAPWNHGGAAALLTAGWPAAGSGGRPGESGRSAGRADGTADSSGSSGRGYMARTSASIKDVARAAGVSIGTVSNVLNRPDIVSPERRDRVLEAIRELGYVRNDAARQLKMGRSSTVGAIVLDMGNPFYAQLVAG